MKSKYHITQRSPYKGLHSVCNPITDLPSEQGWLVQLGRMALKDKLLGLSANQLGITAQAFVTNVPGDGIRYYINPDLTVIDHDEFEYEEVCASYRRSTCDRLRYSHVIIDYHTFGG